MPLGGSNDNLDTLILGIDVDTVNHEIFVLKIFRETNFYMNDPLPCKLTLVLYAKFS